MESDKDRLTQTTSQGAFSTNWYLSLNAIIEIVFDTGRQNRQDEIREERRREETRRFWDNHQIRLGTTAGQEYL